MFTGLIEATGTLRSRSRKDGGSRIAVDAEFPGDDPLVLGESIAVQGVCLTVDGISPSGFESDLLDETLSRSTLGALPIGATLNLERAMKARGRFGGHIVQGHVDETGRVAEIAKRGRDFEVRIACSPSFTRCCIEKGSVAVDGVSLTIVAVEEGMVAVDVIPHTSAATNLASLRPGAAVNLEADVIGRYVARLMGIRSAGLTEDSLRKAGFDV